MFNLINHQKHQKRNRKLFKKYMQIYIKTNIKKVTERNNKYLF